MDDQKREKLIADFAAMYERQEADPAKAVGMTKQEVRQLKSDIGAAYSEAGTPDLEDPARQKMGGKRWPQLQEITRQMAYGLQEFTEIADATAPPEVLLHAVNLDMAASRFLKATDNIQSGGHNGSLMAATAADALCERCLTQADADRNRPDLPQQLRDDVGIAFAGPLQMQEDKKEREARLLERKAQAGKPIQQNLTDVQKNAATGQLVQAFYDGLKPQHP